MVNRSEEKGGGSTTDLALKIARIVDLCGKWSGLADFENTVDRGSADRGSADSGLLGPKRNLDHRSFFSLGRYLNDELIQIISFFERSSLKLRCEIVIAGFQCHAIQNRSK